MKSIQHKLCKVRPSRVRLTFDVEYGDSVREIPLPFVILVIGNFSGHNNETNTIRSDPVNLTPATIDTYMRELRPIIKITVPYVLDDSKEKLSVSLSFYKIEDFGILSIIHQVAELREYYSDVQALNEVAALADGNEDLNEKITSLQGDIDAIDTLIRDIENYIGVSGTISVS